MKTTVLISFILCFLSACSETSTEPEPELKEPVDTISGVYYLRGQQTHWFWNCFNCFNDENPFKNFTEFSVNVQLVQDKVDTVRIYGLEGADAGVAEKKVFPDCYHPDDCKIYGKLHPSGDIEIELEQDGRSYSALWSDNTLRGTFSHGEISVKYDLLGKRVRLRNE